MKKRRFDAERAVDAAELRLIGELARARDVTDRREQLVLHDRPQNDVGAEPLGMRGGLGLELLRLTQGRADRVGAVANLDGPASRLVQIEQIDGVFGGLDLWRMTERRHRRAGALDERRCSCRRSKLGHEQVGDGRLDARVGRVEDDEAMSAEELVDPAGERAADRGSRTVVASERGRRSPE